ncbi:PiggyBac transposable element-derived protein 4 [Cryptotermes secundus]|uniref:PiggyBac transposable element-derived protein 4 n=2 Tax=Cryptotermes secundus TaxID=105785 RepID=A0A2J7QM52_9NEOP|nr:PiggyBac transposable element-derived protein 4 [Cryptotermes secundus]PNF37848.1 PiggyBac transposable element-derived protein 4 [Cryptotermes secundus]
MEPQKRARYSKRLDAEELQEILMEEESDEELDDINDFTDPRPGILSSSSSSSSDNEAEEPEIRFRHRRPGDLPKVLDFTGPPSGINRSAAPNINSQSSPFSIFILFFQQIFQILVQESNRYFHQFLARQDAPGPSVQPPDVTIEEIYNFLAIIIQMGHDQRDTLKDYWSRDEQYYTPFYRNTMVRDRFLHILRFLHFENNDAPPNRDDPEYDRLWKIRKIFDNLNNKFCELYNPAERLAVDEVIVLFKGRVIFRQYIPKKRKRFGIKIYKLCDSLGYTYDMTVYLGKQRQLATEQITSTHGIVLQLIRRVEGLGHKIYMDNYFSSPALFDDLLDRKINSCGTVRNDRRGMPQDIRPKSMKLKKGDVVTRVKGHLSVVRWKDKRDVYVLTNLHPPPLEGNFRDESGHAVKPHVIEDYNAHMGFVDKSDRMVNSYGIARRTWKWTKKLFFHLLDMTILNAYLLHKSCGGKMTHKKFREVLVRDLILESHEANLTVSGVSRGRPSSSGAQMVRLEVKHSQHWPAKGKQRRCRVCSQNKKRKMTFYYCEKCDVALCVADCFRRWHTRVKV